MTTTAIKTTKCCRCNGTGFYCNADGRVCFRCNGSGAVVADVFLRVMGTKGEFYGVTGPVINGKQYKGITRGVNDLMDGYAATPITEEQARKFFKRFNGTNTSVLAGAPR